MALAACGAPVGGAAKREQPASRKRNSVAATNAGRSAGSNTAGASLPHSHRAGECARSNEADRRMIVVTVIRPGEGKPTRTQVATHHGREPTGHVHFERGA